MTSKYRKVKLVIIGPSNVGKTHLLFAHFTNYTFPLKWHPRVFDSYSELFTLDGEEYIVEPWDCTTAEGQEKLRPLYYPRTSVFLLCFSVDSEETLTQSIDNYLKGLKSYMYSCQERIPVILVATKIDQRIGPKRLQCISYDQGYKVAKEHNLFYMETSALTRHGLKQLFEYAIKLGANNIQRKGVYGAKICGPQNLMSPQDVKGRRQKAQPLVTWPIVPVPPQCPWIKVKNSIYGDHMVSALQDPKASDIVFLVQGVNKVKCHEVKGHKVILCSASNFFCHVFGIDYPEVDDNDKIPMKFTWRDINDGKVAGLSSIADVEDEEGHQITKITISDDITCSTFRHVLEFLYTGLPILEEGPDNIILQDLRRVAKIFWLPWLSQVAENIDNDEDFLNPSISSYLIDGMGQRAKALFLGKKIFSDVTFKMNDSIIPAHKVILTSRCEVMTRMFNGHFSESASKQVTIQDEDQSSFLALLTYLYTDRAPIDDNNNTAVLAMADRYDQERLKNLCEDNITKEVAQNAGEDIANMDIDVIGLLLGAQAHNAHQLATWCLHFISVNYMAFTERSEFNQLDKTNLECVQKNRWPPVSYLEEMEQTKALRMEQMEALTVVKKNKKCQVM